MALAFSPRSFTTGILQVTSRGARTTTTLLSNASVLRGGTSALRGFRTSRLNLNQSGCETRGYCYYPISRSLGRIGKSNGGDPLVQVRFQSTGSKRDERPVLKSWKFEDITSSLPKTSNDPSPTHDPNIQKNPSSPILIDVREPAELSSTGIIPGAHSIPIASQPDALFLSPEEFETRFGYPKPGVDVAGGTETGGAGTTDTATSSPIVFYCKAGPRAKAAAQLATQAGYDPARIGVYEGSWLDWASKGGKAEKWEGEE